MQWIEAGVKEKGTWLLGAELAIDCSIKFEVKDLKCKSKEVSVSVCIKEQVGDVSQCLLNTQSWNGIGKLV